jgi:hypothetical protein
MKGRGVPNEDQKLIFKGAHGVLRLTAMPRIQHRARAGRTFPAYTPVPPAPTSNDLHNVAGSVATPLRVEVEALQCRFVACDEQDRRPFFVAIDVLKPAAARHRKVVEFLPINPLAVDDRVTHAFEWRDQ